MILLVQKCVTSTDGKRHSNEEKNDVGQEASLPESIWRALNLLIWHESGVVSGQGVDAHGAIDHAKDTKAVEYKQT